MRSSEVTSKEIEAEYLELQGSSSTRINLIQLVLFVQQFPVSEQLRTYGTKEDDLFYESSLYGLANTLLNYVRYAEDYLEEADLIKYHYWLERAVQHIQTYSKIPENLIKAANLAQLARDEDKSFVAITVYPTPLVILDSQFPGIDLEAKEPMHLPSPVEHITITNYYKETNNLINSPGEWGYQIDYEKMVDRLLEKINSLFVTDLSQLSVTEKEELLNSIASWLVEATYAIGNPNQTPEVKYSFGREKEMINLLRKLLPFVQFPEFLEQAIEKVKYLEETSWISEELGILYEDPQSLTVEELELTLQHALEYLAPVDPRTFSEEERQAVTKQIESLLVFNAHRTARVITDPQEIEWIESEIIPVLARYRNSPEFLKEVVRAIPLDRQ